MQLPKEKFVDCYHHFGILLEHGLQLLLQKSNACRKFTKIRKNWKLFQKDMEKLDKKLNTYPFIGIQIAEISSFRFLNIINDYTRFWRFAPENPKTLQSNPPSGRNPAIDPPPSQGVWDPIISSAWTPKRARTGSYASLGIMWDQ